MNAIFSFNVTRLLAALSMSLDYTREGLTSHHRRVTYIALSLGQKMNLSSEKMYTLFCASTLHDIGAITFADKHKLANIEIVSPEVHCEKGYQFLKGMSQFHHSALIIRHHHHRWNQPAPDIDSDLLTLSYLIHLADRIEVLLTPSYILSQRKCVIDKIRKLFGSYFPPEYEDLLLETVKKESFWLDLESIYLDNIIENMLIPTPHIEMRSQEIKDIASIFASIIDSKSRFTHRHSSLVCATSKELARLAGFSGEQTAQMEVAGLLHDLGKLSVPESILEKQGSLTPEEYDFIKQHTYHTYHILNHIPGFSTIAEWAAYHHERLDGCGYPFHIDGASLSTGSRIVAVADIFSALAEDRPYRLGMKQEKITDILQKMVKGKGIDGDLATLLLDHYDTFDHLKNSLSS
ncbi:HD domain-containing phosphohydrolase [Heliorestis convoluta]|uniref:Metal-dependent phosphohydrolase, HD subdomain n=1 Tax=Heliorestis convoluta TaxID=356322 RepID=A0A5Q2MYV5_9FIRM|nr:HD domain-containing phosphohydrolase [Heliorestis convoluta]QGG47171.1 metal-dependent phosphohydrolase, HD subdomain [Heliorestis convoluta]